MVCNPFSVAHEKTTSKESIIQIITVNDLKNQSMKGFMYMVSLRMSRNLESLRSVTVSIDAD